MTSTKMINSNQSWKDKTKPNVGDWKVKGGLAQML